MEPSNTLSTKLAVRLTSLTKSLISRVSRRKEPRAKDAKDAEVSTVRTGSCPSLFVERCLACEADSVRTKPKWPQKAQKKTTENLTQRRKDAKVNLRIPAAGLPLLSSVNFHLRKSAFICGSDCLFLFCVFCAFSRLFLGSATRLGRPRPAAAGRQRSTGVAPSGPSSFHFSPLTLRRARRLLRAGLSPS